MWVTLVAVLGMCICALLAVRARRLLLSALWLACTSALLAVLLYLLGAPDVAVIELSVGAGLVTILFVFGISIAGEDSMDLAPLVPWATAAALVIVPLALLGWLLLPAADPAAAVAEPSFSVMLWQERGLDVLVQIGLIFAGVLGVLGILAEAETAQVARRAAGAAPAQTEGRGAETAVVVVKES